MLRLGLDGSIVHILSALQLIRACADTLRLSTLLHLYRIIIVFSTFNLLLTTINPIYLFGSGNWYSVVMSGEWDI